MNSEVFGVYSVARQRQSDARISNTSRMRFTLQQDGPAAPPTTPSYLVRLVCIGMCFESAGTPAHSSAKHDSEFCPAANGWKQESGVDFERELEVCDKLKFSRC